MRGNPGQPGSAGHPGATGPLGAPGLTGTKGMYLRGASGKRGSAPPPLPPERTVTTLYYETLSGASLIQRSHRWGHVTDNGKREGGGGMAGKQEREEENMGSVERRVSEEGCCPGICSLFLTSRLGSESLGAGNSRPWHCHSVFLKICN